VDAASGAVAGADEAVRQQQQAQAQRRIPFGQSRPQSSSPAPQAPQYQRAPAPQPSAPPLARPTNNSNIVISPYPPGNQVDVRNFRPGDLVKEPGTGNIFRVP
jgi:hypothetical protein